MANHHHALRIALYRAWEAVRDRWFEHEGKEKATGAEVRDLMQRWLAKDPNPSQNLLRFWYPRSEEQKKEALQQAFPDKEYSSGKQEEEERVIELLQEYRDRFDEILNLIRDKRSLTPAEKDRAHLLLKDLKADLKEEAKEENRRGGQMSDAERHFFYPAIQKAHANIGVKWNSDPIKSNWHSDLSGALMDITHPLFKLETRRKEDSK